MERIKQLFKRDEPVKWLFYGDSITHGAVHTWGRRDYSELFRERILFELARGQDIVINTATSGNATIELLDTFDWRAGQFKPDACFLMIGMNDCAESRNMPRDQFEANLHELADRFDAMGTVTVMQTTCPILPGGAPDREPYFDDFMQAIRDVAAQRSLPLIDHTAWWHKTAPALDYWMDNAFHPNAFGHRAFAHLLFRDLDIFDPTSPTCRLFVP